MRLLDLFSGIGGFHLGFEQAGFEFEWVGFSEIDKYASGVYRHRFPGAKELGDVKSIRPERDLPYHIDILCGGFPCQAFSVAGKRKGFEDTRGTLFFEIARILRHYKETKKPIDYFVLENVKGLLSHEDGRTFAVIYGVLADLGYTIECQLLNTRWFLPQNRERIYIVGHLRSGSGPKVFPIGKTSATNGSKVKLNQIGTIGNDTEATRVYDIKGNSSTLTDGGGMGAKTGLYQIQPVSTPNQTSIRRLTPIECEKLQGFPVDWTSEGEMNGKVVKMSDTQRYKQCGNAVTVDVVQAVAEKIRLLKC
jgi:DNA (cytosine-5)-methyltransferase 1